MEPFNESERCSFELNGSVSVVCSCYGKFERGPAPQSKSLRGSQVAGNVAGLPAKDMNSMALSFFAARTLYMGLYMSIKSDTLALARTGVYFWSITIPMFGLWRAGKAIAQS